MASSKSDESEVWVGDEVPDSVLIELAEFETSGKPLEAAASEVAGSVAHQMLQAVAGFQ